DILFQENEKGETPLHIAEEHQHFAIAEELIEERHFISHAQRHDFLKHVDHNGHNSLHNIVHLWHISHAADMWHLSLDHLIKMLEQYPAEALAWKDKEGKPVYESLLSMNETEKKHFVEVLIHKGIITVEHGHLVIPPLLKEKLHIESGSSYHNLTALAELYVNSYPLYVNDEESPRNLNTENVHPTHPHPE
ncbi:MAG: hypothetical protein ACHQII_06850, partial [Bacteroidia bacterium]